jgi:uncharacterized FlgJ-related protein
MIENILILILSALLIVFLLVSVGLSRSLDRIRTKLSSDDFPEGYVDFIEKSRGAAFDYIEETQSRVELFINEVSPMIEGINTKSTKKDLVTILSTVNKHIKELSQVLPSTK